jgi:hypothetical protein
MPMTFTAEQSLRNSCPIPGEAADYSFLTMNGAVRRSKESAKLAVDAANSSFHS